MVVLMRVILSTIESESSDESETLGVSGGFRMLAKRAEE